MWGDILSIVEGVQYRGGYHEYHGGYLEYRGGCSVLWGDIMMHMGDIMSTVEGVQYRGGKNLLLFEYPMVLNTFMVLMISPTYIMISPTVLKFQRMVSPHSTEHPHGTHDILHVHHDIPHSTEHHPQYSR